MQKSILVPLDFSEVTSSVIAEAASLASDTGLRLALVHVISPEVVATPYYLSSSTVAKEVQERVSRAQKKLDTYASSLREKGIEVSAEILEGAAVGSILKAAESPEIRYIAIGSHGHGMVYNLPVGSTTHGVLRRAKVPVFIVPVAP